MVPCKSSFYLQWSPRTCTCTSVKRHIQIVDAVSDSESDRWDSKAHTWSSVSEILRFPNPVLTWSDREPDCAWILAGSLALTWWLPHTLQNVCINICKMQKIHWLKSYGQESHFLCGTMPFAALFIISLQCYHPDCVSGYLIQYLSCTSEGCHKWLYKII